MKNSKNNFKIKNYQEASFILALFQTPILTKSKYELSKYYFHDS